MAHLPSTFYLPFFRSDYEIKSRAQTIYIMNTKWSWLDEMRQIANRIQHETAILLTFIPNSLSRIYTIVQRTFIIACFLSRKWCAIFIQKTFITTHCISALLLCFSIRIVSTWIKSRNSPYFWINAPFKNTFSVFIVILLLTRVDGDFLETIAISHKEN